MLNDVEKAPYIREKRVMFPLAMVKAGDLVMVAKIGGPVEVRKHLEDLGFVPGSRVDIIAAGGDGNIIVNQKGARLAITEEMARRIMVSPSRKAAM